MPIDYPNFRQLRAEDVGGLGGFDLGEAIKTGLENSRRYQQAKYEPRNLENAAQGQELLNKISEAKAKYAEQKEAANLDYMRAGTGNLQQQMEAKRQALQRQNFLQNLLSGGNPDLPKPTGSNRPGDMTGHGYKGSVAPTNPENNYSNTGEDRQNEQEIVDNGGDSIKPSLAQNINKGIYNKGKIISQGDPRLAHINEVYDKYPQYRKELEAMGLKKIQTVKFDPKTGTTSVITTMPNGEVRVNTQGNISENGTIPLTNNVKTYHETIVSAAPQAKKIVDDIISAPSPAKPYLLGNIYRSGAQAQHSGLVAGGAETLQKALGFPNTNEGLHQALKQIERHEWEGDTDYRNRLRKLKNDIDSKVKNSKRVLKNGVSVTEENQDINDPLGIR